MKDKSKSAKVTPATEYEPGSELSKETRRIHISDIALRQAGFRIHARPTVGEAVWSLNGLLFKQSEAILRLTNLEKIKEQQNG